MTRACVLLCVLSACGGATGRGAVTPPDGPAPAYLEATDDPVALEMQRIAARMREAGLAPGPIEGRGFLTTRDQRTDAIEVPPGTCVTLVALAARGVRDLDATLFSPEGDVLAEDIEPDAHPTVQVCGGEEGRRLYYGLSAYDGAGSYLYASFRGDRASFEAAARIVGGRPGVVSDGSARGDQDVRLRELGRGLARRGFQPHGEPVAVPLAADQRIRMPLEAERGHCYTVAALSMSGLEDVDVRILDELDGELATDRSPAADATAQLCVERDAHLTVEVHASRGEGEARVAFFEAGDASVGGTSGLWLGERAEARLARAPLDEAVAADLRAAQALGWRSPARRAGGQLVAGEAVSHRLRIASGGCSRVVASGGRGIGKLRLRVVAEDGEVLAEPVPEGSTAVATICPDRARAVDAQVTARRGAGSFALHVLSARPPAELPAEAPEVVRGALVEALERAGAPGWSSRRGPQRIALDGEGVARVPVDPASGGCSQVHVAAAQPVTSELRRDGALEQRLAGRAHTLLVCPTPGGTGTPGIEIRGAPGTDIWLTISHRE